LYPLYHPAAALYTAATLEALRIDFERIPSLLALGAPEQPQPVQEILEIDEPLGSEVYEQLTPASEGPAVDQLGLF
jgi:DNA polymerase